MLVYRIARERYTALDGEGARLYGGRWNSPGRAIIYTSSTRALAALEVLVHVTPRTAPSDLVLLTIEVDDAMAFDTIDVSQLPRGWRERVDVPACREIGDAWFDGATPRVLRVPAAPMPEEFNVLLAASLVAEGHAHIVEQRAFQFDPRLID